MSEPVWWCPECEGLFGGPYNHLSIVGDVPCLGTPIDLIAERERLRAVIGNAAWELACHSGTPDGAIGEEIGKEMLASLDQPLSES